MAELEYPLVEKEYYVDVVWKLKKEHTPLMTFEVETSDNRSIFSNTLKIYGTPSNKVTKPWKHFMIIFKGNLSTGHRDNLTNLISQHNLYLFEDIYDKQENKKKIEEKLESLSLKNNLTEQIKKEMQTRSLGETLQEVLRGLSEGMGNDLGIPEVSVIFKLPNIPKEGTPFSIVSETPKGEPTVLDRIKEAQNTLKPFTIESPQLKDLIMNGKSLFSKDKGKASITIAPQPRPIRPVRLEVLRSSLAFDNLLLRLVKTEGTIDHLSTEERNLPFVFNFTIDHTGKDDNYKFEFKSEKGDVEQAYRFEELVSAINEYKDIAIVNPENNNPILCFHVHENIEQSKDWRYLLSKLAYIQQKTNHKIPSPSKITQEDVKDIFAIIKVIDTGEDSGSIGEIKMKIQKKGAKNLIEMQRNQGKVSSMKITQNTGINLFNEKILFGKSTIDLPDMQFALPIDDVEKLVDSITDDSLISLAMKPMMDKRITIRFEDWPPKK